MKNSKKSIILKNLSKLSAYFVLTVFSSIMLYIFVKGVGHLSLNLFDFKYTLENVSLMPAMINTLYIILISVSLSTIIGVSAAIYLEEFINKNNKYIFYLNLAIETLSGIPSVIYGLFGFLFFVEYMKIGISILAGSLTVSIMILPLIIKISQEAIKTVPIDYRLGSYGLGANKLTTILKIVLPNAKKGIFVSILLSIGRIIGESACFIYTAGTIAEIASLFSSGRTLTLHMYILANEGLYLEKSYATALVILIFVIVLNLISKQLYKKGEKNV